MNTNTNKTIKLSKAQEKVMNTDFIFKELDDAFIATMEIAIMFGDNHERVARLLRECIGVVKSAFWLELISNEQYTNIYRSLADSESRILSKGV